MKLLMPHLVSIPHRTRAALGVAALASFAAAAQAPTDVRVALVIGNSAYAGTAALVNPANDAIAMGSTLKTLGFTVVELKDGSHGQMVAAVTQVRESLKGRQGIGVLYYAGHGLQVDFRNYMVPVDAKLATAGDVSRQTVDVGTVIEAFKAAGNRMNILVLDACRDNPFASQASGKGLAPLDAPSGTLLAYSTAPGNVADDGDSADGGGLYTGYLVKELQKPATRIEDVFKRVRLQVRQKSQGRQIPWESTSLEEDFYFNDGVKHTFRAEDLQKVSDAVRQREQQLQREAQDAKERELQQAAQKALLALKDAEAQRLKGLELAAEQAREQERLNRLSAEKAREEAFRAEKADWDRIQASTNADDFFTFLQKYPNGYVSEQALLRLDALQKMRLQAQTAPDAPKALPAGAQRYYVGDVFESDTIDGFTKVARRGVNRVTRATADIVEFNGGATVLTQDGTMRKNAFGVHEPGVVLVPSDLVVGKRWRTAYQTTRPDGVKETSYWTWKVAALENVTVPAGTFRAYRIEGTGEARYPMGMTTLTGTTWIDPATMLTVRADRLFRAGSTITDYFSNVLVRRQLVPRPS